MSKTVTIKIPEFKRTLGMIGFYIFITVLFLTSGIAVASDFGCKAVLCISTGSAPKECKPTLKKLFKRLREGHSFPKCKTAGDNTGGYGKEIAPCDHAYGPEFIGRRIGEDGGTPVCSKRLDPCFALDGNGCYQNFPIRIRHYIDIEGIGRRYFYIDGRGQP